MRRGLLICGLIGLTTAHSFATEVKDVLGKLGQTTENTKIFSRPSSKSRVFYSAKAYEYIIINSSKYSGWLTVVMSNGQNGYAKADAIARLPYDVTRDRVQTPELASGLPAVGASNNSNSDAKAMIAQYALKYTGTPYKWGGEDLRNGIDCSAFVKKLFGQIGINLPRTAAEQATVGSPVKRLEDLKSGDRLYFWDRKRGKIGHTGLYLGNGYFVHSSSNHKGVATDPLTERWQRILVAARR